MQGYAGGQQADCDGRSGQPAVVMQGGQPHNAASPHVQEARRTGAL